MGTLGRRSVVAHIGHERAVFLWHQRRLDTAITDDGLASGPSDSTVVADTDQAERISIRVEGQQYSAGWQFERMGTREPAHAREILVVRQRDEARCTLRERTRLLQVLLEDASGLSSHIFRLK